MLSYYKTPLELFGKDAFQFSELLEKHDDQDQDYHQPPEGLAAGAGDEFFPGSPV